LKQFKLYAISLQRENSASGAGVQLHAEASLCSVCLSALLHLHWIPDVHDGHTLLGSRCGRCRSCSRGLCALLLLVLLVLLQLQHEVVDRWRHSCSCCDVDCEVTGP
jgi:hypothetical protein